MSENVGRREPFREVFDLVQDYASREGDDAYDYHVRALDIIAGVYTYRLETAFPPDVRGIVETILSRYDWMVRDPGRGALDPAGVDAVVAATLVAAMIDGNRGIKWGTRTLFKVLDALTEPTNSRQAPDLLANDTRLVAEGLKRLADFYQPLFVGAARERDES